MKEKLIIRNFGPIKSVELDLGRFNILIGEQATGKSTVAKVLAVCRYFSYIIGDSISEGLQAWGLFEHLNPDSYIFYECRHYSLVIERQNKHFKSKDFGIDATSRDFQPKITPISIEFKNLLTELEKIKPRETDFTEGSPEYDFDYIGWTIPTSFFLNDVKNVMDNPFYLPTERGLQSIFSIGQSSIQNLSDSLFSQFAKMDGIVRQFKKETYIEPLNIYYVNRNGHGFIRKANETQYYSLFNAASGYQSMIPAVLAIKYYIEVRKRNKTFLIEEPELNLFPSAQDKLMQYLVDKTISNDNTILVTTHSPYTLTSLNNMMYAYQMGKLDEQRTSEIIEKKYWMNPDDVSAYMMNTEGGCEDIFDREEGMIKAEKIDAVSTEINKTFDKLLNIEFKENELNT